MIALIQRVSDGKVEVNGKSIASIDKGIVALVAVQKHDTSETIQRLFTRLIKYRIFPDQNDKMNLSLLDIQGGLILVPQFTLLADTKRGNRPSFSHNVAPEIGRKYFNELLAYAQQHDVNVQAGEFGADMRVNLTNDGPVTFWLEV